MPSKLRCHLGTVECEVCRGSTLVPNRSQAIEDGELGEAKERDKILAGYQELGLGGAEVSYRQRHGSFSLLGSAHKRQKGGEKWLKDALQ
jgi:hypothetical protein